MIREVPAVARRTSRIGHVLRVIRLVSRHQRRRRESLSAVGGLHDLDTVRLAVIECAHVVGNIDITVACDRDVRILKIAFSWRQVHRVGPRCAVIGRADKVDVRYLAAGEPSPREIGGAIATPPGAIGLDRGLVVKDAEQVRRRRTFADDHRAEETLAVLERIAVFAGGVVESRDPDVAEGLRGTGRIAGALGAHEDSPMTVPRDHRVAGCRGSHQRECCVRRRVVWISGHQRALKTGPAILGTIIAEPDRPRRDRRAVGVIAVVVDAAIIIGAADEHPKIAWIDRHGGFVLPTLRSRALAQCRVGIRNARSERVGTDITAARKVVGQAHIAEHSARRSRSNCEHQQARTNSLFHEASSVACAPTLVEAAH